MSAILIQRGWREYRMRKRQLEESYRVLRAKLAKCVRKTSTCTHVLNNACTMYVHCTYYLHVNVTVTSRNVHVTNVHVHVCIVHVGSVS